MEKYYDATDCILGRIASVAAKDLMKGGKVVILNSEKAIISGNPKYNIRKYKEKVDRGDPYHGPFYPKYPDQIVKRQVRGMLPKSPRGRVALKNLRVYLSTPQELEGKPLSRPEQASRKPQGKYIKLGELSVKVGAKKVWDMKVPETRPLEQEGNDDEPAGTEQGKS